MSFQERNILHTFSRCFINCLKLVAQVNEAISLESKIVTNYTFIHFPFQLFWKIFNKFTSNFLAHHNFFQTILLVPLLYPSSIARILLLLQFS